MKRQFSITIDKAIGRFVRHLEFKNCTDKTIKWYRTILECWANYAKQRQKTMTNSITEDDIIEYIIFLRNEKGNNTASQNNKLRALRSFFSYCVKNNYTKINPVSNLKIKEVKKLPATFQLEDLKKLLSQPDRSTFAGYRDYVIMVLLMDSAMRISECINLKIQDLVFEGSNIHAIFLTNTKSRVVQRVNLTSVVSDVLVEWIDYLDKSGYTGDYLFPARGENRPVSVRNIQDRIQNYGKKIGLPKCSPHMFRHTFGKVFTETGGNTRSLQEHLRHSNISVTQIYSQIGAKSLKNIVEKHSPSSLLIDAGWIPG